MNQLWSSTRRMPRGLCGLALLGLLILWNAAIGPAVWGGTGGGTCTPIPGCDPNQPCCPGCPPCCAGGECCTSGGNTTFTTSTTHHTTVIGVASGGQCPVVDHTNQTVMTTATFGPATIAIGDDQSQSCFVASGTENFNTNTDTTSFIKVCRQVATALSPWALEVCAVLLTIGAIWRIRRRTNHAAGE